MQVGRPFPLSSLSLLRETHTAGNASNARAHTQLERRIIASAILMVLKFAFLFGGRTYSSALT